MISEIKVEILHLLTIYNLLVAIGLLSEKSKYKKVLCLVILLVTLASSMDYIIIDGTIGLIICASSMLFSATCVFSPEVERKAIEGRDEDEE